MENTVFKPVELDEKFNIDNCRVSIGCGAFKPYNQKEFEHIPQCYQCINKHCTIGLNNYMLFKDCLEE